MTTITTAFWGNNPSVLFKKSDIMELWPTTNMDYERKQNAIVRFIILLTCIGFIFTFSLKILAVGIVTLIIIYVLHTYNSKKVEGFTQPITHKQTQLPTSILGKNKIINPETLEETLKENFVANNSKNPFSNVLLSEIKYDVNRKAAAPSFNPQIYEDITIATKKMVQDLNPDIINTDKQLFGDLAEKFELDQSNRAFYSTANTRVVNDQGAYSKFLYGNMPSCKNNDTLECVKDNYRYTLY